MTPLPLAGPATSSIQRLGRRCIRDKCFSYAATDLGLCVPCLRALQALPGGVRR